MCLKRAVNGIGLVLWSLGLVTIVRAEDFSASENVRVVVEQAPEHFLIQMVVFELRGNVQRALKEAGFEEEGGGQRYVATAEQSSEDSDTGRRWCPAEDFFSRIRKSTSARVLTRPQIRTLAGQVAEISSRSSKSSKIPYLVLKDKDTFELRQMDLETPLGFNMSLTAREGGNPDQIAISPLKLSMTIMEGREPIPDVDLDVGKPIVSTRTLETSITVFESPRVYAIAIPGLPNQQAVVLFCAQRVKAKPAANQDADLGATEENQQPVPGKLEKTR